jgi:hypothetical protein
VSEESKRLPYSNLGYSRCPLKTGGLREVRLWSGLAVLSGDLLECLYCLARNGGKNLARVERTLSRRVPAIAATFGRP